MKFQDLFKAVNRDTAHAAAKGVAYAAAGMALVLTILLIAQFFQIRAVDPINSAPLQALMEQMKENPQDQVLRDQIRALDLLARKAYFTSQWQLRTGGIMLLGAMVLLLGSLRIMRDLRTPLPHPEGCADYSDHWLIQSRARRWIAACGMALVTTSLVAAVITHGDMAGQGPSKMAGAKAEDFQKNWANFRGPGGNGVAASATAPVEFDGAAKTNLKWKIETPKPGYSSPVVWEKRLYVTGADENLQQLYAYDVDNGSLVWTHDVTGIEGSPSTPPDVHSDTGYAPSTVATDGSHVCAVYPTGDLVCVDAQGKRLWGQNLGKPDNHYGHASSLIIHENVLIVQYDENRGSKLLGLNVATGETLWRAPRTVISWSSPIVVNTGGRYELILTNSTSVESYDPKTGLKLWGQDCMAGEMGPSAAYADGWVYAANDYALVVGLKLNGQGAEVAWEYDENMPDTASPLATPELLFIACSYGTLVCLDAKTGEVQWQQDLDDGFYASPILVGDHVYATDLQGVTHIFKASRTWEPVAQSGLGETTACTPAVVGGRLYHRGEKSLFCFE